jgi:23S rRNA (guanosine2251-2'-O)-methyltransferase
MTMNDKVPEYIYGINAVATLLDINAGNRKIHEVIISENKSKKKRIEKIAALARGKNIKVIMAREKDFKDMTEGDKSAQNVIAKVSEYNTGDIYHYLKNNIRPCSKLVMLDGVTDIGNFSSILRNCFAFGCDGVILSKKRSAALNRRVSRLSAGALEGLKIFRVTNLDRTIKSLKEAGFWIYGASHESSENIKDIKDTEFTSPLVLVMGSEDKGMSRIVSGDCDVLFSIRMSGKMESLNVSVASGIILYYIQEEYERAKN